MGHQWQLYLLLPQWWPLLVSKTISTIEISNIPSETVYYRYKVVGLQMILEHPMVSEKAILRICQTETSQFEGNPMDQA